VVGVTQRAFAVTPTTPHMLRRCQPSPALLQGRGISLHPPPVHPLPWVIAPSSASQGTDHPRPVVINGTADIEALIQQLQRPDALATALELHLPAHTDAEALARLLKVVDALAEQGTLTALRVTVEGSDRGPIDEALREALAGSRACLVLSGKTVRPLIFRDLAGLQALHDRLLGDFLDMNLAYQMERPLEEHKADTLIGIALSTGEDALLRAIAVLSPRYQCHFAELPDPLVYETLARHGVACNLSLPLDGARAQLLIDWLYLPHPALRAIELNVTQSLGVDVSMSLWTRLVNQPSMQSVVVNIASGVTIAWSPRTQAALAPTTRINTLRVRLEDLCKEPPEIVGHLMEWFHPMRFSLRSTWVPTGAHMFDAIGAPAHHLPLHSLSLTCDTPFGADGLSLSLALIQFLRQFDRVLHVCVRMQHGLPSQAILDDLETVAGQSQVLRSVKLIQTNRHWVADSYRFDKPARLGLGRGRFFQAYVVTGAKAFFVRHLGTIDPFRDDFRALEHEPAPTLEQALLSSGFLVLAQSSRETHQAAMAHRAELQAPVVIDAMIKGLLDPPALRELLTGPSGELDTDLVMAVFRHLCEAPEDEAVWRLFDAATAFH